LRASGDIAAMRNISVQAPMSPGVARSPVTSWSTKCRSAGLSEASTGNPHAIARGMLRPRTESSIAGTARRVLAESSPGSSSSRGAPTQCTREPMPSRSILARSEPRALPSPANTSDQSSRCPTVLAKAVTSVSRPRLSVNCPT
jgi:hypothetical protein